MAKKKQELSEEEMVAKREEINNFYKENIEHLKVQLEYEGMLRDIEKARAERVQAQMFLAQAVHRLHLVKILTQLLMKFQPEGL